MDNFYKLNIELSLYKDNMNINIINYEIYKKHNKKMVTR